MADTKITGLGESTAPDDADVFPNVDVSDTSMAATGTDKKVTWANLKATLKTYFDTLYVTTGTVVDFAGSSAPTGWLICNGATISQSTYAALYAIIGHTYGADPGGGNFILPDCRGKATVGYLAADSNFGALGNVAAGEKTHLLTSAESGVPAHGHPYHDPYPATKALQWGGGSDWAVNTSAVTGNNTAANASSAHNNIQPSIVFNKIIKT
jgi:microcystin-dependent protein